MNETADFAKTRRQRLAVVHDPDALSAIHLHELTGSFCDLIWVVDDSLAGSDRPDRILSRLGAVVEIDGDLPATIDRLAAERPDGIVAFSDRRILLASKLGEALGLRYPSSDCALRLVNKFDQRSTFVQAGIDSPRFWRVAASADWTAADAVLAAARFPIVVKPEIGNGSRHIELAKDRAAGARVLKLARDAGRDTVVEEFIVGVRHMETEIADYVSVESVVSDGVIIHAGITGRFPLAAPFRETGFFMPALVRDRDRTEILALTTAALRALGVEVGCFHTEIKLTPLGPRIIEVNGRLGGGMSDLLSLVSDVSLIEMAARVALGEAPAFDNLVSCNGTSYLFYVQAPADASRVIAITGLDDLDRLPGVVNVRLNRPAGSAVDWRDGNHGYVFSVLGSTPDRANLLEMARIVREKLVITYEFHRRGSTAAPIGADLGSGER